MRVQFDVTKVEETQSSKDLDVQVQCSCPAFLYWGAQWNLHQRDGLLAPPARCSRPRPRGSDLRGNFVICKHIHAVFERVLPSVQHNIVKILREREVQRRKEKQERLPSKLHERQDEMRRRKQREKLPQAEDTEIREKMLESLRAEEEARLLHEQQLENQGVHAEEGEVARDHPATEPAKEKEAPAWMKLPKHYQPEPEEAEAEAITGLTEDEEENIEEKHREGQPHLHKGLPYETEEGE